MAYFLKKLLMYDKGQIITQQSVNMEEALKMEIIRAELDSGMGGWFQHQLLLCVCVVGPKAPSLPC
jgi:hypothetical protein